MTANTPHERNPARDPFTVFMAVACVVLAALAAFLALQNRELKRQLSVAKAAPPEDALRAGDTVEPLDLVDEDGEATRLEFGQRDVRTLLLVYSSTCPACERNMPVWIEMLAAPTPPSIRIVGIRTDVEGAPTPAPAMPFPVFSVERSAAAALERIPYVPATILLDPQGTVLDAWFGVLTRDQRDALMRDLTAKPGPAAGSRSPTRPAA